MTVATAEYEREYQRLRPRLFGIAYRMLGSVAEAEDVVQEVWIRWQNYPHETVHNVDAFLTATTTRLAINVTQSARKRRETYVGPWLPEPVDTTADPALGAERAEALSLGIMILMEKLTPSQRAAYILREAFDYPYEQIGEIIGQSAQSCRQLVSRARKLIDDGRHNQVGKAEHRRLVDSFVAAARSGDVKSLEALFAEDVVSYSDGGGQVRASKIPVLGRDRVARFIHAFAGHFWTGAEIEPIEINGDPAVRLSRDSKAYAIVTLTADQDGIGQLLWMMNPDKITRIHTAG
jgi:RNA polymerase sigma-70 factor (ECF subfamily)